MDQCVKIQDARLTYYRGNQFFLRFESYQGVHDYLKSVAEKHASTNEPANIGKMVILPSSFTDSPRYLQQKYQDAIAMVREFGKPDLFITFTCNPKWREISENLP